ncbi:hypothetical protein Tco_0961274 [Tanacetum coccineum]
MVLLSELMNSSRSNSTEDKILQRVISLKSVALRMIEELLKNVTEEEARLLLTKYDDRGALNFEDVAAELTQIPIDRVAIVCDDSPNGKTMLDSIPEEI